MEYAGSLSRPKRCNNAGQIIGLAIDNALGDWVAIRDEEMIEIASAVPAGAMAYLKRQYKVVAMVFAVLLVILTGLGFAGIVSLVTPVGVLFACVFSGTCGWFGMKMATNASARTTFAVKESLDEGLKVAFRAGAVMGLIVVGFALLDVSLWFAIWNVAG